MSRLRARLEATGRIEAAPARSGGRPVSVLALTDKGHKLAAELDQASGERFSRLFHHIPPARRIGVLAALGDLNAALAELEPTSRTDAATLVEARAVVDADETSLLSRRQVEVLRIVARGLSTAQIADHLAIGRRTVESHRLHISRKLGLKTVADIRRHVLKRGR